MTRMTHLPQIDLMLQALRISRDRLDARCKVAVDPRLVMKTLRQIVAAMPFDEAFYRATYDDIAAAHDRGEIADLHQHFIEAGYFEGRLGADPGVDESYYIAANPDVARAIATGKVRSAQEHFLQRGAAEGRAPNPETAGLMEHWLAALRPG